MRSRSSARLLGLLVGALAATSGLAGGLGARNVAAVTAGELRDWDAYLGRLEDQSVLRAGTPRADTLLPDRQHVRLSQFHHGVPVWGAEIVRQSKDGTPLSVFGTFYEDVAVETRPGLTAERALGVLAARGAQPFGSQGRPELVVLPHDDAYTLAWKVRALVQGDIRLYFVDAQTAAVVMEFSDLQSQAALGSVGNGTGVLSDRKKVSARQDGSTFVADDTLRPPHIRTYDYKGDLLRLLFLQSAFDLLPSDLARDSDNSWTDGAAVDAHAYAGYTYDYYFKRFGRRGLDNFDIPISSVVHPVNRADRFNYPPSIVGQFFTNAFYAGEGLMVYGEGLSPGQTSGGKSWNFTSGALDVVAHELTHGVTDYSSGLIYQGQSGALNESFSDMMGTSVEFYYQTPGNGPLQADYLIGEDVITPGGLRSMQNPAAYGDPDHISLLFTGAADNGGVHTNSGIPNNVFYLAIEGGTNRVSGVAVAGVGGANREQIEKVFYRAFAFMLPRGATFSIARSATIQAARDLYGSGSAPERAVTQAWTAVGVQ